MARSCSPVPDRLGVRVAALLAALLILPVPGRAQTAVVDNPHGDFRADCTTCHVAEAWTPAKISDDFDHSQYGYPLDGAHRDVPCLLCHLTLEFSSTTGTVCEECHQDVHAGELGTECDRCHTTRSFVDRTNEIRNHRLTRFPLSGVHATLDCAACHGPGDATAMQFANTPSDCYACHQADYAAAANPVHEGRLSTECAECHSAMSWGAGTFDHDLTRFPLTGAHRPLDCAECHGGGTGDEQFANTPMECVACHQADYDAAASPVHTAPTFSTE